MSAGDAALVESEGGRRSTRVPVRLNLRWVRLGQVEEVVAADISLHGLFFCTSRKPKTGSLLQVEMELPGGSVRLFVVARYVGNTRSGTGVGVEIFLADNSAAWRAYYFAELARHQTRAQQQQRAQAR